MGRLRVNAVGKSLEWAGFERGRRDGEKIRDLEARVNRAEIRLRSRVLRAMVSGRRIRSANEAFYKWRNLQRTDFHVLRRKSKVFAVLR